MPRVINRPNCRREIQFNDAVGKWQTKMPKRDAETVKTRIEHLLTTQIMKRPIEGDRARWVASLEDVLVDCLVKVGLIRQREFPHAPKPQHRAGRFGTLAKVFSESPLDAGDGTV